MIADRLTLLEGDITQQQVAAIVNAANSTLLGGGGVDGAIHRAAGWRLRVECATLGGCATGEAKITKGYNLPAEYVIHTVGPVWRGGDRGESELLANCYRNSLALAVQHRLPTIAFPSISTGVYGYPIEKASRIALATVEAFLKQEPSIEKVLFVCFGKSDYNCYASAFKEIVRDQS